MTCSVDDCGSKTAAGGMCGKHYARFKRHGSPHVNLRDPKPSPRCTMDDCDSVVVGRGLCRKHYQRWYKHGDPEARLRQRDPGPPETRWMDKVSVESPGCWMWTAGKSEGYGAYEGTRAHQYVYTLLVGPVPEGTELDHLCRRRACCNPDHLEPVSHLINVQRGLTGTRIRRSPEERAKKAAYMREWQRKRRAAKRAQPKE